MNTTAKAVRSLVWTVSGYAGSVVIRFGSNIVLTRLLNPELFGMLLIVHTVRQGVELSTDIGFAQNIIHNKAGATATFYNTVWVMQIVRAAMLSVILFLCAAPIAKLYSVPVTAFEVSAAIILVSGWTSTGLYLLHRTMQLGKINLFELAQDALSAVIVILAAMIDPSIELLLIAGLIGQVIRTITSHFLTPERNRFVFQKDYAAKIFTFGRWLFLSSALSFLSASFDRLYIGKVAPLAVLGIYGLARSLAEMPSALAARIGYSVVFPFVSSAQTLPRSEIRATLRTSRLTFLIVAAISIALGITISDIAIRIIYDARYHDAEWMLPILMLGVWPALLCSINEYTMLGLGRPLYNVFGNALKLAYYLTVLPLAFGHLGILGAILTIIFSEGVRYVCVGIGQWRENISFLKQDAAATVFFGLIVILLCWTRSRAGFGTPFDNVPVEQISTIIGKLF